MASNDTSSDIARGTADGGAAAARAFTHSSAAVVLPGAASRVASELGAVGAAAGAGGRGAGAHLGAADARRRFAAVRT